MAKRGCDGGTNRVTDIMSLTKHVKDNRTMSSRELGEGWGYTILIFTLSSSPPYLFLFLSFPLFLPFDRRMFMSPPPHLRPLPVATPLYSNNNPDVPVMGQDGASILFLKWINSIPSYSMNIIINYICNLQKIHSINLYSSFSYILKFSLKKRHTEANGDAPYVNGQNTLGRERWDKEWKGGIMTWDWDLILNSSLV